jgi:RimJ/RimL family protein N-acetyltransferase
MSVIIREGRPEDAEHIIAYLQELAEELGIDVPLAPGEFNTTVEEEVKFIEKHRDAENSILLVVEDGGRIIGVLNCKGGTRKANRHATTLGISLLKDWRNQGIGHELMTRAIEWAKGTGIVTRIELSVFARNARAIHLYEKLGFVREGYCHRVFYQNGEYIDTLIMALLF